MEKVDVVTLNHLLMVYLGISNKCSLLKKEAYNILLDNGYTASELDDIENKFENN